MATITHFGVRVTRYRELTHFYTPENFAPCADCGKSSWEVYRLTGERVRCCFSCTSTRVSERPAPAGRPR